MRVGFESMIKIEYYSDGKELKIVMKPRLRFKVLLFFLSLITSAFDLSHLVKEAQSILGSATKYRCKGEDCD